jgi:hypothetical protein
MVVGFLVGTGDTLFGMTRPTEQERVIHETNRSSVVPIMAGTGVAFFLYLALLVITFAVKTKANLVGISFLVLGAIAVGITFFWGIIPFALLLPAAIFAIRHKPRSVATI